MNPIISESEQKRFISKIQAAQVFDCVGRLISLPLSSEILGEKILIELKEKCLSNF